VLVEKLRDLLLVERREADLDDVDDGVLDEVEDVLLAVGERRLDDL
jgi:hypothetical protein